MTDGRLNVASARNTLPSLHHTIDADTLQLGHINNKFKQTCLQLI